ncbi:MAG: ABC transporter substrate-binding protein [Brevinemataceae bacterium]
MKIIIFFLVVFSISSCSHSNNNGKDVLTVALPIEASGLYPYKANDPHSGRVFSQIFDTLLTRDAEGNIISSLASEWKFVSPTVFELTLKQNITFHNGEPLTIEDVQFSFEQILSSPNFAHTVAPIQQTKIIDANTFQIILKYPYVALLSLLSYQSFGIVNKKAVLEAGEDVSQYPIGTGPYKFVEWKRGQSVLLERFDDYWKTKAKIPYLKFLTVSDNSARAIALESQDVDMAYEIEGMDRQRIQENPDLVFISKSIPRVEYIAMNIGKGNNPLWKAKEGRQAFAYVLNQQAIIDSILFGAAQIGNSLLPPMIEGYDAAIPYRTQNLQKAKELIQTLNVSNPKFTIWVREGLSQKIAEVIQANFREIGVDVSIEIIEYARFLEGIARGDHDVFILNWNTITGDPDYGLNNLLNSQSWGSKGNRSFYSNKEIDRLLAKAQSEFDVNKRIAYYKKVQEIVYDEVPYIPLYYPELSVGTAKYVKGFEFNIFFNHDLENVYFE